GMNLVIVGAWKVNAMAQGAGLEAMLKQRGDTAIVHDGKKLYVAGFTQADTMNAAKTVVDWINANV
ncbi:MAG: hypothetical protein GOV15_02460, partial [Candidatus Diapherotrites archaeon]|nr:hypothetical protein [Candidatus Diapherotrites archaeon]